MLARTRHATLIPVKNMSRAIGFYTKKLGGSLNMRADGEMKDYWASLNIGKSEFWFVKPPKPEKMKLAYNTFTVKNIRSMVKGLKTKGIKFEKAETMSPKDKVEGPITWSPYGASAFFHDSEGNMIMLWQNTMM